LFNIGNICSRWDYIEKEKKHVQRVLTNKKDIFLGAKLDFIKSG
jgi:hypothetical protein